MIINPHLLPKIRSESLRQSAVDMPCTLRIAGFIGLPCMPQTTTVMCHLPVHGKGVSTKVSDLHMACGCAICHALLDGQDQRGLKLRELYPHAFWEQLFKAQAETMSRWVMAGLITGSDWEVI